MSADAPQTTDAALIAVGGDEASYKMVAARG
jgi:hypothetical protein